VIVCYDVCMNERKARMLFKVKPNFNDFLGFVIQPSVSSVSEESGEYDFEVVEGKQLLACGYFDLDGSDVSYVLTYCDPFYTDEVSMFVESALIDISLAKNLLEFINEQ
jgi:hypothetical protein